MNNNLLGLLENEEINVYGLKPFELDDKIWSKEIENEVLSNYFMHMDFRIMSKKAENNFNMQKNIILKSLKAIYFKTCPKVVVGNSGQIYLFFPYSNDARYIHTTDSKGELAFVGIGTVCVITPKNENILYVLFNKLDDEKHIVNEISFEKLEKAIKDDNLIILEDGSL